MTRTAVMAAALALAVTLPTVSAQAQNGTLTRSFVSSTGVDTNACTIAAPCATFAHAYTVIGANGIIAALDPGKYGPITITGPVTINGNGWAAITGPSSGTAITISSVSGNVILTGLEIDGAGVANNGIDFTGSSSVTGGTLHVENSVIRNFAGDGLDFTPNTSIQSHIFVSNTVVSDNIGVGIALIPTGGGTTTGLLDRVQVENNGNTGIQVSSNGPNNQNQTVTVTISDSVSANNGGSGILAAVLSGSLPTNVMVRNSTIVNNGAGLNAGSFFATIRVTRSTITGNANGWSVNNGVVLSYGDNNIDGNGSANTEPPNPFNTISDA